ncbi:hypothetical protein [Streptomyces fodineus]|uniref:hypothetical protein n=1 Tax=Streptomyces fodineus TaxID=1904616 RepID=UPI00131AAA3E|nr:hypothetical protein [Streptomyces fodineus]
MEAEQLVEARSRIAGCWIHDFQPEKGALKGAWDLSQDGTFKFRWRETSGFGKAALKGALWAWRGEWDVSEGKKQELGLELRVTRATIPAVYALDAAYLANPPTAFWLGFRTAVVGLKRAHRNRVNGRRLTLAAELEFPTDKPVALNLTLNPSGYSKHSIWPLLSSRTGPSLTWQRF